MLQHQLPTLLALCLPPFEPQGLSSLSPTEHREGCHLASELRHEEQQGFVCWVSVLGPSGTTEGTGLCPGCRAVRRCRPCKGALCGCSVDCTSAGRLSPPLTSLLLRAVPEGIAQRVNFLCTRSDPLPLSPLKCGLTQLTEQQL